MDFLITGVSVNPFLLAGIGFIVGILGGFFGVGGGFLAGPFMFWAGVPANFVVGTDLAHMTGKSIVAAKRHRTMGHVDVKLGLFLVIGTMIGVEIGARIIETLKESVYLDQAIGITYIVILMSISAFTAWESLRAIRMTQAEDMDVQDAIGFDAITTRFRRFRLKPLIDFPVSGIKGLSFWVIFGVGLVTGILSGTLGVGGGFIRMPMLVYFLGMPTHIAVGTDLFSVVFSSGYGTITHALKGNVDILMALVMHTGAALGAQIGANSTRNFEGPRIRLLFSALPVIGALMVFLRLIGVVGH